AAADVHLTVSLTPDQPSAREVVVVTVRSWSDAGHHHRADVEERTLTDVLKATTSGGGNVAIRPLRVSAGVFEGDVVFPDAGRWTIAASTAGIVLRPVTVRVLRAGQLPSRSSSMGGVLVILVVAAVGIAIPEVYFWRRRRRARDLEARQAAREAETA